MAAKVIQVLMVVATMMVVLTVASGGDVLGGRPLDGLTSERPNPRPNRHICCFRAGRAEQARARLEAVGAALGNFLPSVDCQVATLPPAAAARFGGDGDSDVSECELDPPRFPLSLFQDEPVGANPFFEEVIPFGYQQAQADKMWSGPHTAMVCIIDSGLYLNHVDVDKDHTDGTDYVDNLERWEISPGDNGHGTHVHGTIAALQGNGLGIIGVTNKSVEIHHIRVFGGPEGLWVSSASGLILALDACQAAAAAKGTSSLVVSMSLGGSFSSKAEKDAFNRAYEENGVLSVAAAGNDGNNRKSFPASYDGVISVAALDANNAVADFSQTNSQVEIAAAGVGVTSIQERTREGWMYDGTGTGALFPGAVADVDPLPMPGGVSGSVRAQLAPCNLDGTSCSPPNAGPFICFIQRGTYYYDDKISNCRDQADAVGAIIYNNIAGVNSGFAAGFMAFDMSKSLGDPIQGRLDSGETIIVNLTSVDIPEDDHAKKSWYASWAGTSMATPHVSGVLAKLWTGADPACTNVDIRTAMQASALDLGPVGRDSSSGFGLIQGYDAQLALAASCGFSGCSTDSDCNDNNVCNGVETCSSGQCVAGDPLTCGAFCHPENGCVDCLSNADCEDSSFCNGAETCSATGTCQPGSSPCDLPTPTCNEVDDVCDCGCPQEGLNQCEQNTCTENPSCTITSAPDGTTCSLDGGEGECASGVCTTPAPTATPTAAPTPAPASGENAVPNGGFDDDGTLNPWIQETGSCSLVPGWEGNGENTYSSLCDPRSVLTQTFNAEVDLSMATFIVQGNKCQFDVLVDGSTSPEWSVFHNGGTSRYTSPSGAVNIALGSSVKVTLEATANKACDWDSVGLSDSTIGAFSGSAPQRHSLGPQGSTVAAPSTTSSSSAMAATIALVVGAVAGAVLLGVIVVRVRRRYALNRMVQGLEATVMESSSAMPSSTVELQAAYEQQSDDV